MLSSFEFGMGRRSGLAVSKIRKTRFLLEESGLFLGSKAQQIVDGGLIISGQRDQVMGRDLLKSLFVLVILLLGGVQEFAYLFLRKVTVFPKIPQPGIMIHGAHLESIIK